MSTSPSAIAPRLPAAPLWRSVLLCVMLLAASGCPDPPSGTTGQSQGAGGAKTAPPVEARGAELTVWADPPLVNAINGLSGGFSKASKGGKLQLQPVERAELLAWAQSGDPGTHAAPDVLLFGGRDDYLALLEAGRIDENTARTFAGDRLIILKPLNSTYTTPTVFDLYKSRFSELYVGDPAATFVGLLTNQALLSDGAHARIKDRLKLETSSLALAVAPVKAENVLSIALASQAGGSLGVEPMLLVPGDLHEPIEYKAVAAAGKGSDAAVVAFLRWLSEDAETQLALGGYGLVDRATALASQQPVSGGGAPTVEGEPIVSNDPPTVDNPSTPDGGE